MRNNRRIVWLCCIVLLGAALRTYVWFNGYMQDGQPGLLRHGDGYLQMAEAFREGSTGRFFDHWRAYQFVYPLYLVPMYVFDLTDSVYVFWLHHLLAAGTVCLVYASTLRLCGPTGALVSAFIYAVHLQAAYWFNWALADTAFHLHLALWLWFAIRCWYAPSAANVLWMTVTGLMAMFVRPEGLVAAAAFGSALLARATARRIGAIRTMLVFTGAILVMSTAMFTLLAGSKHVREAVLSNVEVGSALYYGSQRTHTRADLVDKALNDMRSVGDAQAAVDPERRSRWYWMGATGLKRIRQHPFMYLAYSTERLVSILFPSFFREGVSFRYKVFDRTMSVFLVAGTLLSIWVTRRTTSVVPALVLSAYSVYLLIAFIQSEWDVRVQLSPQVLLIPVATFGWLWVGRNIALRRAASAVTAPQMTGAH